jgi:hypothetical protein
MKNHFQSFTFLFLVSMTLSIFSLPQASPYPNSYSIIASASAETATSTSEEFATLDKAALLEQIQSVLDSATTAEAKANAQKIKNIVQAFPEKGSSFLDYLNWGTALVAVLSAVITFLVLTVARVKNKE